MCYLLFIVFLQYRAKILSNKPSKETKVYDFDQNTLGKAEAEVHQTIQGGCLSLYGAILEMLTGMLMVA